MELNTYWEPSIQGIEDKRRNDDKDDDTLDDTIPLEVSACWNMFSGLSKEEIVKIFKNKFKSMILYKLRHLHNFEDTWEDDSIVVKNGSLKPRKIKDIYKDFGRSINKVWSEAFLNSILVINILFRTLKLLAAFLLFYCQIITLAQSYN